MQNKHNLWNNSKQTHGRNKLNMPLHKIGLHNSGLCDLCEQPETVKHYIWIV